MSDTIYCLWQYWRHPLFYQIDKTLRLYYYWHNPYRLHRLYYQSLGFDEEAAFGHTPLTTLERLCQAAEVTRFDHFMDLGCGTGESSFWVACHIGCLVTAVDTYPIFIANAKRWQQRYKGPECLKFIEEDMLEIDYTGASVVYFYGLCFSDDFIWKLTQKLRELGRGSRVISISFALSDYSDDFKLWKQVSVRFPWGEADAYIDRKV